MYRLNREIGGSEGYQNFAEKPKNPNESLKTLLKNIAAELNKEAYDLHGLNGLVDQECQIKPAGYVKILGQEVLDESESKVHEREVEFSSANDLVAQQNYGTDDEAQIISLWKQEKKNSKNTQMELAITALLHKVLKDRYFVVRTSEYDDYCNGVDNIIVDKETGTVICAFDEVHDGSKGQLTDKKESKIINKALDGGASIRFGLKIEAGKLQRTSLENLPVFYLGLNTDELKDLLASIDYENIDQLSEQEKTVYAKLMDSVSDQIQALKDKKLPDAVKKNLDQFQQSHKNLISYLK